MDLQDRETTSVVVSSEKQMFDLGWSIAQSLICRTVCLRGDLGAGKTTLAKGIISCLSEVNADLISSPTFQIMNLYPKVAHLDCYRLSTEREFLSMGLDEVFHSPLTVLIEWPEKIASLIPADALQISIQHRAENIREVLIDQF